MIREVQEEIQRIKSILESSKNDYGLCLDPEPREILENELESLENYLEFLIEEQDILHDMGEI